MDSNQRSVGGATMMRFLTLLGSPLILASIAVAAQSREPAENIEFHTPDTPAELLTEILQTPGDQTRVALNGWADVTLAPFGQMHTRQVSARDIPVYELNWPDQTVTEAIAALSYQTNVQVGSDICDAVAATRVPPLKGHLSISAAADHIARAQRDGQLRWTWIAMDAIRFYCESVPETRSVKSTPRAEEVLVLGPRIDPRTLLASSTLAPLQMFDQGDIQKLNMTSAGDFLDYTPQQPYRRADFVMYGEDYAELRGLGWDTTLILIDGKRTFASSIYLNSVDLDNISAALIDRIEVLPDTGSAAYGGEAMGGVVNILLKKQVAAPTLELEYGGMNGGARSQRASLALSHAAERLTSTLVLESLAQDELAGASRRIWRDQDFRRFGRTDFRSPAANPGTVYSLTGANLSGLSSPIAAVPHSIPGDRPSVSDFLATQGQRNYASLSRYYNLMPEKSRHTGFLSSQLEINESTSVSGQLIGVNSDRRTHHEPLSLFGASVPAQNPFNPFGEDVLVDYLLTGVGPEVRSTSTHWVRAGLDVEHRRGNWSWTVAALASNEETNTQTTLGNAARAMEALEQTDPRLALNPFGSGPGGSAELLASLRDTYINRQRSRGQQVSAVLQGPLPEILDRSVQTKLGAEWRRESAFLYITSGGVPLQTNRARDVASVFADLEIPLLEDPLRAALTLSGRLDDYSDSATAINPRLGLMWRPDQRWLLRASYGESTRPASLFEMYTPRIVLVNVTIPDPRRGNQLTPVAFISGGNPDLEAASSRSFTTSVSWQPPEMPWHVLATYWHTQVERQVSMASIFQLLRDESMFSDRIERGDPSSSDRDAGYPGPLLSLDGTKLNGRSIEASGIDVQSEYTAKTSYGTIAAGISATWTGSFRHRNLPGTREIEAVGRARSVYGSIPRWNVVGTLSWELQGIELTTIASWIPAYADADPFGNLTGRTVGSRTYVDAQAACNLDAISDWPGGDGLRLSIGAKNAFNEMPKPADAGGPLGFDPSQFDPAGRQWYLRLDKKF